MRRRSGEKHLLFFIVHNRLLYHPPGRPASARSAPPSQAERAAVAGVLLTILRKSSMLMVPVVEGETPWDFVSTRLAFLSST